jgi:hypothetical protein
MSDLRCVPADTFPSVFGDIEYLAKLIKNITPPEVSNFYQPMNTKFQELKICNSIQPQLNHSAQKNQNY